MIDEDRTLQLYGYISDELTPSSRSMVVAVCDGCGTYRDLQKSVYSDLCRSCAKKGDKNPMFNHQYTGDELDRLSLSHLGCGCSDATKLKIGNANRGNAWSDKQREMLTGENSPHWRGGVTPYRKTLYFSQEYQDWRNSVFERDGFMCMECNEKGDNLRAHHILPIRDWGDPRFSLNIKNGITLCDKCHRKTFGKEYEFFNRYFDIANGIGD